MTEQHQISMEPIGIARTAVPDDEVARRRREMISTIEIYERWREALDGIDAYSHLFVLFWLHRAGAPAALTAHPRGDPQIPAVGLFAARGRNHPNSIGLAVVELLERHDTRLVVRRLDAWDGTPVLDLKPYDHYDVFPEPRVPDWFRRRAVTAPGDPG